MPPMFLERIPTPTFRNFVIFSIVGFGSCMLFAWSHAKDFVIEMANITNNITNEEVDLLFDKLTFSEYINCLGLAITSQFWTVLTLINTCCCLLALVGKGVQLAVFGSLRVSELQQLREKFWNFVFYKFIFIFGVLNVQYMNDAFMWTTWFSLLCSLQMLAQLCKYRFEYLSCSPATPRSLHMKLIFLLTLILLISFCLIAASVVTVLYTDWNIFGFMVAECFLLTAKTVYVLMKYTIYLVDINYDGLWETRGDLAYYTDLVCELAVLLIDLIHYLHMVIWSNIFLSMASLVILMQVRHLFNEIQKRISRHRNYLKVVKSMEARFSEASDEDIIRYDDNCAICWDKMLKARKLPCGHLFHNPCLRSWLAQDISCPTCRVSLSEQKTERQSESDYDEVIPPPDVGNDVPVHHRANVEVPVRPQDDGRVGRTNHLFHFDATQYISWLPRFSVAVTQLNDRQVQNRQPTQLDSMAREVQHVFPSVSLHSILEDLRTTHSVEITMDNILEGRLIILANGSEESSADESDSDDSADSDSDTAEQHALEVHESLPLPEPEVFNASQPGASTDRIGSDSRHLVFPNDPQSRHQLLQERKTELQAKAIQQYYARAKDKNSTASSDTTNISEDKKTK